MRVIRRPLADLGIFSRILVAGLLSQAELQCDRRANDETNA